MSPSRMPECHPAGNERNTEFRTLYFLHGLKAKSVLFSDSRIGVRIVTLSLDMKLIQHIPLYLLTLLSVCDKIHKG